MILKFKNIVICFGRKLETKIFFNKVKLCQENLSTCLKNLSKHYFFACMLVIKKRFHIYITKISKISIGIY